MGTEKEENGAVDSSLKEARKFEENGGGDSVSSKQNNSLRQRLKDQGYRRKVWRTVWLGASFWALGFAVGQKGPAFLDLQIITQTDVESASFFFTAGSVGYLVGSLVAGVVYDKLNKSLLLVLSVLGMGLSTVALPWCSIYTMMIIIHFVGALFAGGLDTAGNAELVRIWGKEGEMAMQFLHFAFAFGGIVGPLATEPFLTPVPEDELNSTTTAPPHSNTSMSSMITTETFNNTDNSTIATFNKTDNSTIATFNKTDNSTIATFNKTDNSTIATFNNTDNSTIATLNNTDNSTIAAFNNTDNSTVAALPLTTDVHYAYLISGSLILLVVVPLTVQMFTDRSQKRRQGRADEKKIDKQPLPTRLFLFVLFTHCVFYFLYCAVDDGFAAFLTTFTVKQLCWSKSKGAQITSVFWASFAAGRFLAIFAVRFLSSAKLLFCSCLSLVLSLLLFFLVSEHGIILGIWIATVLAGMSMAAVFPTGFTWMEEEFLRVTGRVASSILIASSAGNIVNPIILGYLMQEVAPMWFSYLLLGECVLCICNFLFLLALSRFYIQKHYSVKEKAKVLEVTVPSVDQVDADVKTTESQCL